MTRILVAGLINIETTLAVDRFPLDYSPARYPFWGVRSTVSGVGFNIAKALTTLGDPVDLLSLIGRDAAEVLARAELYQARIDGTNVLSQLAATPQSVILYDPQGRRAIHVDLKDAQEQMYPAEIFAESLAKADWAALCNINFTRPMLAKAKSAGIPIATDVHAIADIADDYNRDYLAHATILFQSHERLPCPPEEWARRLWQHYGTPIAVIGLGEAGALLAVKQDNFIERIPAVYTRPVVNTIGAGDALFSAFLHTYAATRDPYTAIQQAMVFASYKIGAIGAAEGFLDAVALAEWCTKTQR